MILRRKKFQNMLTGDEAAMPIIASMLSVISWTVHGVVTKNPWIVTTNIVGLCVHVFYLIIIFKYRQHYQVCLNHLINVFFLSLFLCQLTDVFNLFVSFSVPVHFLNVHCVHGFISYVRDALPLVRVYDTF